jgi:5S rRNA maturation endonuclease (ribonuclease M5)
MKLSEKLERLRLDLKGFDGFAVVEGVRDKELLLRFGFKRVVEIGGKRLDEVVEELRAKGAREVVILTDFDQEGRKMAKRLDGLLESHGIKASHWLRRRVSELFRVKKVEELSSILKLTGGDVYGEGVSTCDKVLDQSRFLNRRFSREA